MRNMTHQMKDQLAVLLNTLRRKEKRYKYTSKFFSKLPGFKWTLNRQREGIKVVKSDLMNKKLDIIQMQKDKKINTIIDV